MKKIKNHIKKWIKDHIDFERIFNDKLICFGVELDLGVPRCVNILLCVWCLTIYF